MRNQRSKRIYLKYFFRRHAPNIFLLILCVILITVLMYKNNQVYNESGQYQAVINNIVRFKSNNFNGFVNKLTGTRKDWHDHDFIAEEAKRTGIGEHGIAHKLDDPGSEDLEKELFNANGFNALLSDMISVNRSVPDIRHKGCWNKTYLSELPTVSVIVPFYDEHLSTLMRTAHGVINRSPEHLIVEVILVDDGSSKSEYFKILF